MTVLAKPSEDPHFVEARPSYVKALNQADLYVQVGFGLEEGYAPLLLSGARNPAVVAGQPGHLDASRAIAPLDVPAGLAIAALRMDELGGDGEDVDPTEARAYLLAHDPELKGAPNA